MDNLHKRYFLFLIGCIGVRSLFVIIAKQINKNYLPYLGTLALLPAFGFLYIYFTGIRKTGPEVFGNKIWWNSLRPVHGLLYLCFAYLAICKSNYAYVPLLIDVIVGLLAFLNYHFFGFSI
jgi:hypothetical protein